MRKHFFGKVVLAVLLAGSLTACANADMVKVKVTNKTDATISIAFAQAQTDSGGEDFSADCSKGWWNIEAGQTKTINTYDHSPFHTVFFYATSKGGKRIWAGKPGNDPMSGDHAFWIHPKKAFNVEGKKITDGKKVYFRRLSYDFGETVVLNLTVKK